jgi:hypothetical protein
MLFVIFLSSSKESIDPWQPCLLAVISVKNNWNTVKLGNLTYVHGASDTSCDGSSIICVVGRLSSDKLTSSLGESYHDWSTVFGSGFHTCVDGVRSNDVNSWDSVSLLLSVIKKILEGLSSNNTRLYGCWELGECL